MTTNRKPSPSRQAPEKETAGLSIDYDHLLRLFAKHWMWLAGGFILGVAGGIVYASTQERIYSATATLYVPLKRASVVDDNGNGGADLSDLNTFQQMLQTRNLPDAVVEKDKLNEDPNFLPSGMPLPCDEGTAAGILAGSFNVSIRPLTRLVDISVEHRSPELAQRLANDLAKVAIEQQNSAQSGGNDTLGQDIEKQIVRLRAQLAEAIRKQTSYETDHNIIPSSNNDNPGGITVSEAHLKELTTQYNAAQTQVTLLSERYGPEHPKLIQARQMVEQLQDALDKARTEANASSGANTEYAGMKADVEAYRAQLAGMLQQKGQTTIVSNVNANGLRVSVEATRPFVPIRPAKKQIVAAGGFIGLLCGAAFVLGIYFLDRSVRTVAQAESTLGLPVIAAVPILAESAGQTRLPTFSDPQSFVAEAFRGLRASLILQDRENPLKTVLVVSAIPGEGKSFCAANTAVAFAQAGLKTLLIDADLRLPTIHKYFNLPNESTGFTDVLTGRGTLEDAVVQSQVPTLKLLLTTIAADSPAELLSNVRMPQVLDEAAKIYDRIVIDSAPLNAVSDTMLIMPKADAILLVVRAAQTPSSESKAAIQKISSSKMKPLGLILNYLAPHTLKAYAYGYSYGQKPPEKKNGK